ncbi:MAG: ATP-binding protein [Clostridiales bacterium]|nr:ATP-binding protein [Clostridiales bacterium]
MAKNGIKDDVFLDVKPKDLLKQLSLRDQTVELDINVPDNFYQTLLEQLLEREYLNDTSHREFYMTPKGKQKPIHWMQITRLPVHPNDNESYDLLSRWQGVLSGLHAWGYRLLFLLLRYEGKTKLYLGTTSTKQEISAEEAVEQLREACFGSMPGMGTRILASNVEVWDEIHAPLSAMDSIGAVTGIPSFRDAEQKGVLQTLDQLAFGIRDINGEDKDYAMLVIADPLSDESIAEIISSHRRLSSQIHTAVKMTGGQSLGRGESKEAEAAAKAGIGILGTVVGGILGASTGAYIGSSIAGAISGAISKQINVNGSASTSREYLDKFAEFAEEATNHHTERLNQGRNYGFWNTGIYVLGSTPRDVVTVTGMLRSIYSGEETYYEPIRLHQFSSNSKALNIVRDRFELLPMIDPEVVKKDGFAYGKDQWHIFGEYYQYLSTPINTKELSLVTSLPRRDVPGLRFVKTAVRFANNPAELRDDKITLGRIVDTGIVQSNTYDIDPNSLVRHALVAGSTGSGKSTTCKRILSEILDRDVPVMVIEPAKDDYVRWAIEMNKSLPAEKQFKIYMPGVDELDGVKMEPLHLNPFEPAAIKGVKVDLLQHCETFITLLNACLPGEDVVPILIEETAYETIRDVAEMLNRDLEEGAVEPMDSYPRIRDMELMASQIMAKKQYFQQNKDNLTEILITRFKYLRRGTRGKILNVFKSIDYNEMFSKNVVINLSRLSGSKDKALIMSMLMQALYEYRVSCYVHDAEYRAKAQQNKLMHLTLIEEAHNVLMKPDNNAASGNPQRAAADLFGNMLSEVRGYGQGFIVVDQVPTRLIDDAIKNTNYKIVHRLTAPDDQEVMASCMAFRDDQKYIIPALEKGNAIICGDEDDAAAWVKIPAPSKPV